ncbi:2',3'-cyclic-nucleotide 3'-phosphodiesterase [Dioszegia hungarica]|uniref:2',3'-cyclic-nucleotide 3'-phosphodiesterase n=1 Tax=Dioszegia hungarica TaxID=4972 RepID=A0AA38H7Y0_9TREE|nr:2',3'-cyclic-nucleotide 3'-phosphodiesterase [Dioszegia hungarica]KAI9635390.1 2',3'-cyclic-nucleotide 3'-phosphodiesterase [Dioszegia hungarica]
MASGVLSVWSLWLEPDEKTNLKFRNAITSLSSLSPASPNFLPHVTLYGSIDLSTEPSVIRKHLEAIIAQSRQSEPLRLPVLSPSTGEAFFQCILAPVEPVEPLLKLQSRCEEVWGRKSPYFPHVSLKYGDIGAERREEIAERAREESLPEMVAVRGISIVRCVGMADQWEVVDVVPFD